LKFDVCEAAIMHKGGTKLGPTFKKKKHPIICHGRRVMGFPRKLVSLYLQGGVLFFQSSKEANLGAAFTEP
jgi:hypothetical protein